MEIYQLQVFLAVARCLNFTEAAESLNLTQPAVSAKIKSLETDLKCSLFDRLGRQIQLTEVGKYLVKEAEKLIELEAAISDRVKTFQRDSSRCIKIGSSLGLAQSWLPKIIFQYQQKYPQLKAKLTVFESNKLLQQAIEQHKIDLAFSAIKFNNLAEVTQQQIPLIQYGLIVKSNSLLIKKNWQTLAEIKQKPLILLSDRFASRRKFESRLAELDLKLADFPYLEIDTIGLMRTYLTQGDYIGFASNLEFQGELDSKTLKFISLQEFALPSNIYICLASKNKDNKASPLDKFLALLPANDTHISPIIKSSSHTQTITINIGIQNGTIPTITAGLILQRLKLLEHFLPNTGKYASVKYDVQWHNFLSGMPIAEGLRKQKLDIGILGDYPLLQSAVSQDDFTADNATRLVSFVAINPNGEGNAIIVPHNSPLETIEDLKGETVALPLGSSAHGMLLRTLSDLDLLSQVQLFPLKNSQLKTPQHSQIAAGYAYFSPFHQLASDRGNFKYLFHDNLTQLPGFYGVVVSQSFAQRYPEIIVSYLQALIAAQNWLAKTPSAFSLVSKWTKVKPAILDSILGSSFSENTSSLFINDWQIRPDWVDSHITQLQKVPNLKTLQIPLDRWIQPEFLQAARQN